MWLMQDTLRLLNMQEMKRLKTSWKCHSQRPPQIIIQIKKVNLMCQWIRTPVWYIAWLMMGKKSRHLGTIIRCSKSLECQRKRRNSWHHTIKWRWWLARNKGHLHYNHRYCKWLWLRLRMQHRKLCKMSKRRCLERKCSESKNKERMLLQCSIRLNRCNLWQSKRISLLSQWQ